MSYSSANTRKSGTIASSAADPMTWDMSHDQGRAALVLTVTASANCNLNIQEAPSSAELASPTLSLPHKFVEALTANTTRRVVLPVDPSLPVGKAWLSDGSGNYVLDAGRRAHS